MGKTFRTDSLTTEEDMMDIYDKLASQWAERVELARKRKMAHRKYV